jgi:hypothetical protein
MDIIDHLDLRRLPTLILKGSKEVLQMLRPQCRRRVAFKVDRLLGHHRIPLWVVILRMDSQLGPLKCKLNN